MEVGCSDNNGPGKLGSGAGNVTIGSGASLTLDSINSTISGALSGAGTLTEVNGSLTLTGDSSSYSGAIHLAGGTVQVGGGTSGSLGSGNISGSGSLVFSRSNDSTFSGSIVSGSSISVSKQGAGTLTLSGNNYGSSLT